MVDFDKADVFRNGEPVTGPDLPGLSGAPIWRLPDEKDESPVLAGVIIAWRKVDPKRIVATRGSVLWPFLVARFAGLSASPLRTG